MLTCDIPMTHHHDRPLQSFSPVFKYLQYSTTPTPRVTGTSTPASAAGAAGAAGAAASEASTASASASTPDGMVAVPAATPYYEYVVNADEDQSCDMQYYYEAFPGKTHAVRLPVEAFYIDETPVTGKEYEAFLNASGYWPADDYNFLTNWAGSKSCPDNLANRAVTYVSQNEARLFCAWANKRLPQEWEWQYAAQGPTNGSSSRNFPWGNGNCTDCTPAMVVGKKAPLSPVVGQHSPQGSSPFGMQDIVGTVWQYTTEVSDLHTRSNMLRGGSNYKPGIDGVPGSHWYFPMVTQVNHHNHYRLMSDSYVPSLSTPPQ